MAEVGENLGCVARLMESLVKKVGVSESTGEIFDAASFEFILINLAKIDEIPDFRYVATEAGKKNCFSR